MTQARIFLSHSSKDKPLVRKLAIGLRTLGVAPWLDEMEIKPGDSLFGRIGEGLATSDYVFAFISESSVNSRWVSEELRSMMNTQLQTGETKVIPIKIDDATMPWFLAEKLHLDFRDWTAEDRYRAAFDKMVAAFGWIPSIRCRKTEIEFLKVEEGPFKCGPNLQWDHLPTFWISRFVLTAANLLPYLDQKETEAGHRLFTNSHRVREQVRNGEAMFPARYAPIGIGRAFAHWAGFSLPTERQWEKAARGTDGRAFPWGDNWDAARCNIGHKWDSEHLVPVDAFPEGISPYGCFNMIGNVVEVTSTEVADNENDTHYAGKGGSFLTGNLSPVTTYAQSPCSDFGEYPHYGYRFVVSDPTPEGFAF